MERGSSRSHEAVESQMRRWYGKSMGTDAQEQLIKNLLDDIARMERELGCSKAKIQKMVYSLRQVALIAEAGRIVDFDEKHACLLAQIMDGVNEVRPLSYPTPQQLWAAVQEAQTLRQTLAQKKEALAQCRGASSMENQE